MPRRKPLLHPYEAGPEDYVVSMPHHRPLSAKERFAAAYIAQLMEMEVAQAVETPGVPVDSVTAALVEMQQMTRHVATGSVAPATPARSTEPVLAANGMAMDEDRGEEEVDSRINMAGRWAARQADLSRATYGDSGASAAEAVTNQLRAKQSIFEFGKITAGLRAQTRQEQEKLLASSRSTGRPMDFSAAIYRPGNLRRPGTGEPSTEAMAAASNFAARYQPQAEPEVPTPGEGPVPEELAPPQATEEIDDDDDVIVDDELTNLAAVAASAPTGEAGTAEDPIDLTLDEDLLGSDNDVVTTDTTNGGFVEKKSVNQPVLGPDLKWGRASGSKRPRGARFTVADTFTSGTDRKEPKKKSPRMTRKTTGPRTQKTRPRTIIGGTLRPSLAEREQIPRRARSQRTRSQTMRSRYLLG